MKITGAIFDLDGTLVDSMKIWDVLPGKVVRSFGAEPTDDLAYQLAAMDKQEAADYMIKTFLLPLSREEVLNRVNELVDEEYSSIVPLKKGADVLLEFLHSNKIPCSIATASEVSQAEQAMKRLGQWECFQFVLSCSAAPKAVRKSTIRQQKEWELLRNRPLCLRMRCMRRRQQKRQDLWSWGYLTLLRRRMSRRCAQCATSTFQVWMTQCF